MFTQSSTTPHNRDTNKKLVKIIHVLLEDPESVSFRKPVPHKGKSSIIQLLVWEIIRKQLKNLSISIKFGDRTTSLSIKLLKRHLMIFNFVGTTANSTTTLHRRCTIKQQLYRNHFGNQSNKISPKFTKALKVS